MRSTFAALGLATLATAALFLPSCAGSDCNFHSQCGPRHFCDEGTCRQQCALDTDCTAAEVCSPIGMCDPGVRVDAGTPLDAGTPPRDTGVPPEDTGAPPRDTGTPPRDTGTPPLDTGPPPTGDGEYLEDCTLDVDCASSHCITELAGASRVCTQACTRDTDCADWHFCNNATAGMAAFCAYDDIGSPCDGDVMGDECAFACLYSGRAGAGHCTHRCVSAADCAGGYACVLSDAGDPASLKVCAWINRPCRTEATECSTSLGVCGPDAFGSTDGTWCTGACRAASDCPRVFGAAYTCGRPSPEIPIDLCVPSVTAGDGASGEPCAADNDCRSGACARPEPTSPSAICIERCLPTAGCAAGFGCNAVLLSGTGEAANVCLPAGLGRSGAPCTRNSMCRSGACSASAASCIDSCQSGHCPPGFVCTPEGVTVDGIALRSCRRP